MDTNTIGDLEMPKRPPRNVNMNKWCEYHRAVVHDTNDCYTLKHEIEKQIKTGHLGRFVKRNDRQEVP